MCSYGENTLAAQSPYEAPPNVEQLAGRPADLRGLVSELVQEKAAVFERSAPVALRHGFRLLAVQSRPGVEVDGWNTVRQAGALLDFRDRLARYTRYIATVGAVL
jgi:hypothetical protein